MFNGAHGRGRNNIGESIESKYSHKAQQVRLRGILVQLRTKADNSIYSPLVD